MRIDAHQHYWNISRTDYGWITEELPILYRNFEPQDLQPALKTHQMDGSILVQAAASLEETEYILKLSQNEPSVLGVVGWIDLFHPEHLQHFERFSRYEKFVGFRIMLQDMPDASCILEPTVIAALQQYALMDAPIDPLMKCEQLDVVVKLLEQVPNLRGVIDHIGKPSISSGFNSDWDIQMSKLASYSSIYCKLSGMVTEADHQSWKPDDFVTYIQKVITWFGPERVMFGSDWPVCLLAADYDQVMDIVIHALPLTWSDYESARLFGENAKNFYKIDE